MARPSAETYAWVQDADYAEAGCITVVVGMDGDATRQALGAEESPVSETFTRDETGTPLVSVHQSPGPAPEVTVLVEQNGFEGSRVEVLSRLSRKGAAASAFWNVEGVVRFGCARRGKVLTSFELDDLVDDVPARLRSIVERSADELGPGVALALVQQFTKVDVSDVGGVRAPVEAYRIIDPVFSVYATPEELVRLEMPSAELISAVQASSSEQRWGLADWAARQAIVAGHLSDQEEVARFVEQHARPRKLMPALSAMRSAAERELMALWIDINSPEGTPEHRARTDEVGQRHWALECLAYLAQPNDVAAALGSTYCANLLIAADDEDPSFVNAALDELRS